MDVNIPGYTIIREINKGGMATIYLATQHNLARQVALKVMSPQLASDPAFGERFLREARIVASLNHHNIVPVYDVGHCQDYHYLSMEYLPGGDLKGHIKNGIDPDLALRILYEILGALIYVHSKSYIHRDIKPENILFREDQTAVLTDFGIAKLVDSSGVGMTSNGMIVGSPRYMSPEQVKTEPIDFRTDLYSLGAVLYETLTGRQLYYAESPIGVAFKHISEPIPGLPARFALLQPVLEKLLAKDPADRYQSAMDAAFALKPFLLTPCEHWAEALSPPLVPGNEEHRNTRKRIGLMPAIDALVLYCAGPVAAEKSPATSALTLVGAEASAALFQAPAKICEEKPRPPKIETALYGGAVFAVAIVASLLFSHSNPRLIEAVQAENAITRPPMTMPDASAYPLALAIAPKPLAESVEPAPENAAQAVPATPEPIRQLLSEADDALRQYRLMQPPELSAYNKFVRILALDAGNLAARNGLDEIVERYMTLGQRALLNEDVKKAQQYFYRARLILTRHPTGTEILQRTRATQTDIADTGLGLASQALAREEIDRAQHYVDLASSIVTGYRLNTKTSRLAKNMQDTLNQIRARQAKTNARNHVEKWKRVLLESRSLSVDDLAQAHSSYMLLARKYPDESDTNAARDIYANAFFLSGKKHFKHNAMAASKRLISMGLEISPDDENLQDLNARWERKMAGKETFIDRFY